MVVLTVYWSNLFISFGVLGVAWFLTRCSTMEAIGMALIAFVSANILENGRRWFGRAPIGSSLQLAPPKRKNPRDVCEHDDHLPKVENELHGSIELENLKSKDEIDD